MKTKVCFKCGKEKPIDEFYIHKQMKDGHLGKCKECAREDQRRHEDEHPGSVFESRYATCMKNPTMRNAQKVIEAAIKAGKIKRPTVCMGCGCDNSEHRIEAHHHNYAKPLDVIWLCTPCHRQMDTRRRMQEGKKPYGRSKAHG